MKLTKPGDRHLADPCISGWRFDLPMLPQILRTCLLVKTPPNFSMGTFIFLTSWILNKRKETSYLMNTSSHSRVVSHFEKNSSPVRRNETPPGGVKLKSDRNEQSGRREWKGGAFPFTMQRCFVRNDSIFTDDLSPKLLCDVVQP